MSYNPRRRELFELLCDGVQGPINKQNVLRSVQRLLPNLLPNALKSFFSVVRRKGIACHRSKGRFLKKNSKWLDGTLLLVPVKTGRPKKQGLVSYWTKLRRVKALRSSTSAAELAIAAEKSMRQEGHEDAAKLIHEITQTSPARASKIRKTSEGSKTEKSVINYEDEGLALFFQLGLTTEQHQQVRNGAIERNLPHFYPPYHSILAAKKRCYPVESAMNFTEIFASVNLQDLLNHTAERIVLLQDTAINSLHAQAR